MFCVKCGKDNKDTAKFCVGCGAALNPTSAESTPASTAIETSATPEAYTYTPAPVVRKSNVRSRLLKIAIPVAILSVIAIALSFFGIFKSDAKETLEKYAKASAAGDLKTMYEVVLNPYDIEYMMKVANIKSEEELLESLLKSEKSYRDILKEQFGDNITAKIKFGKVTEYSKSDIKALNKYLAKKGKNTYGDGDVLEDIQVIEATLTFKGSKSEDIDSGELVVYKMKGNWYINQTEAVPSVINLGLPGLYDADSIDEAIEEYK